jgi:hypothetical protein
MTSEKIRIFFILLLALIFSSLLLVLYSRTVPPSSNISPPYVSVIGASLENGNITIELEAVNTLSFPINVTGGYITVLNTGQNFTVPHLYIVNSTRFNVSAPASPMDFNFSLVTVQGVLRGYLQGSLVYIAFSQPTPLNYVLSIKILNISYFSGEANVTLQVFSPVSVTVVKVVNPSLISASQSFFIATNLGNQTFNLTIPPGTHVIIMHFDLPDYSFKEIPKGSYYLIAETQLIFHFTPAREELVRLYYYGGVQAS